MDIVFTSLEALILKATLEYLPTPDAAALDAFCAVMKDSAEGPTLAAKALATRIQSSNAREALLALVAVDRCMRHGDVRFHSEIGKFRFLNELIKLVSPKYYADRTPPEVQQRILQLLHAWSIEYPKETKFKVAFDMLRSQGVVKETPLPLPPEHGTPEPMPPRPRAAAFEDDEKSKLLQKLLQSKNPDDLQYANKLIKNMVREEERRAEETSRRVLETRAGLESARLLSSLLEQAAGAGEEERQLIRELDAACRQRHAQLLLLAAETSEPQLGDVLEAIDELTEVFAKYKNVTSEQAQTDLLQAARATHRADSLLDLVGLNVGAAARDSQRVIARSNDIDALSDIFSTENGPASTELLKPVSLISSVKNCLFIDAEASVGVSERVGAGLAVLDTLGAELLQQSLPGGRVGESFVGKSTKKIPMNALERISPPSETAPDAHKLDLDFLVSKTKEAIARNRPAKQPPPNAVDDLILDITMETAEEVTHTTRNLQTNDTNKTIDVQKNKIEDEPARSNSNELLDTNLSVTELKIEQKNYPDTVVDKLPEAQREEKKVEVRSLADIDISLASIQASSVPPLKLLEEAEGLTLVLHVATNRPRPDVYVLVLSTTSKHKSPVSDYKFHAVVPKCCKVRLLPASGTCLPPHSPFLQSAAIIQLMLISRPMAEPAQTTSLKFVVTYCCDDDTFTEMGEVASLPLD